MHTYKLKAKCRTGESTGKRERVIGIVKMRAKRKIEAKPLETDSHPRSGVLNLSCLTIAIFPFQIHLPPFLHFHWKLFVTTRYVCVCVCALFHFVLFVVDTFAGFLWSLFHIYCGFIEANQIKWRWCFVTKCCWPRLQVNMLLLCWVPWEMSMQWCVLFYFIESVD